MNLNDYCINGAYIRVLCPITNAEQSDIDDTDRTMEKRSNKAEVELRSVLNCFIQTTNTGKVTEQHAEEERE